MTTALEYLEKTATKTSSPKSAIEKFRLALRNHGKKVAEESRRIAEESKQATHRATASVEKNTQELGKKVDKNNLSATRKSLIYGGGSGTAGGYASSQLATSKDDSL